MQTNAGTGLGIPADCGVLLVTFAARWTSPAPAAQVHSLMGDDFQKANLVVPPFTHVTRSPAFT